MNILFVSVRQRHIYLGYVISSECVVDEDHYCFTLTSTIYIYVMVHSQYPSKNVQVEIDVLSNNMKIF